MKITINHIIVLIFLFFLSNTNGQEILNGNSQLGNLEINNFSNKFLGRPESFCSSLRSNKSKKIYFGTYKDILEYDGNKMKSISIEGEIEDEIVPSFTRTLLEDTEMNIYAAGSGFFGKIERNSFGDSEYVSLMQRLPDSINPYSQVFWGGVNKDKEIYLYTRELIFKYNGESFDKIWKLSDREEGIDAKGTIQTLIKVEDRIFARVWGIGLFELKNNQFKYLENSKIFSNNRIESMVSVDDNKIAIFSSKLGVLLYDGNNFISHNNKELNNWVKEKLIYNYPEIKKLSNGNFPLISFEGGIIILDDKLNIVNLVDLSDGLLSNTITSVFSDINDDLYITSLLSASKIRLSNTITSFGESNGIKGLVQRIKKINNKIYFSTTEDIYKVRNSYSPIKNSEIEDLEFNDIPKHFISVGDYILSVNNLNSILKRGKKKFLFSNDRLLESPIQSSLDKSLILFSHPIDGIVFYKVTNSGIVKKIASEKIGNQIGVLGIKEIKKGILFVEAVNNEGSFIAKYDRYGRITFSRLLTPENEKIIINSELSGDQIFNSVINNEEFNPLELNLLETAFGVFIFDQNLDLYKLSEGNKLVYTDQNLFPIFEKNLLNYDPISRVANLTGRQNFTSVNFTTKNNWFLTSSGFLEVSFRQNGEFEVIEEYPFGTIDPNELSGAILADNYGEENLLWIGSKDSKLISYLPSKYATEQKITVLPIINQVILNNQISNFEINDYNYNSSRNLKINYSFPSFEKAENNLFRYRLIGLNENWTEWSKSVEAIFTNLFEGDYTFEVQAIDANLNESEIISHSFSINPPWYRSLIAYFFYIIFLGLSVWIVGKIQAKRSLSKAENERREKDLEEAKQIQESMLPKTFPEVEGLEITAGLITSTEVGGDYYDFFEDLSAKEKGVYVICGDATGHGTAAGMMVSIIKSALNGLPALPVNEILGRLNNIVKRINLGRLRMSLNVAKISKNYIEISAAAMPPTYLFKSKSNKCKEIMIEGLPLGGLKDEKFNLEKHKFESGDILVMLSDGLPEAANYKNEMFDYERIKLLIEKNGNKKPIELKQILFDKLNYWLDGGIPEDDVTLVVVKKTV